MREELIKEFEGIIRKLLWKKFKNVSNDLKDLWINALATALADYVIGILPKAECHIIWNLEKRFKCKGCSVLGVCKYYERNQYKADLEKNLGGGG